MLTINKGREKYGRSHANATSARWVRRLNGDPSNEIKTDFVNIIFEGARVWHTKIVHNDINLELLDSENLAVSLCFGANTFPLHVAAELGFTMK